MSMYYIITDRCAGCGGCNFQCPLHCIDTSVHPCRIDPARCSGCGVCYQTCPIRAIERIPL